MKEECIIENEHDKEYFTIIANHQAMMLRKEDLKVIVKEYLTKYPLQDVSYIEVVKKLEARVCSAIPSEKEEMIILDSESCEPGN